VDALEEDVDVGVLRVGLRQCDGGRLDGVPADDRRLHARLPAEVVVEVDTEHQQH
jgi:hypothetical protein